MSSNSSLSSFLFSIMMMPAALMGATSNEAGVIVTSQSAHESAEKANELVMYDVQQPTYLTPDFYQAQQATLSANSATLFFSGRKNAQSPLQIWALDLESRSAKPLTSTTSDATFPHPIARGHLIFLEAGDLHRLNLTNGSIERITYSRGAINHLSTFLDGRLHVMMARQSGLHPMLIHPDGTWMTSYGDRTFTSVDDVYSDQHTTRYVANHQLVGVSKANPFANPTIDDAMTFGHVTASNGRILASARMGGQSYDIYEFVDGSWQLLMTSKNHLIDPVIIANRQVAFLPSIVKPKMDYGYLVTVDAFRAPEKFADHARVVLISDGQELGRFEPESDGSLYLKVPANLPFRLELRDQEDQVLSAMTDPIWVRPNERRICVGCHISPRYAPPNRALQALDLEPHRVVRPESIP